MAEPDISRPLACASPAEQAAARERRWYFQRILETGLARAALESDAGLRDWCTIHLTPGAPVVRASTYEGREPYWTETKDIRTTICDTLAGYHSDRVDQRAEGWPRELRDEPRRPVIMRGALHSIVDKYARSRRNHSANGLVVAILARHFRRIRFSCWDIHQYDKLALPIIYSAADKFWLPRPMLRTLFHRDFPVGRCGEGESLTQTYWLAGQFYRELAADAKARLLAVALGKANVRADLAMQQTALAPTEVSAKLKRRVRRVLGRDPMGALRRALPPADFADLLIIIGTADPERVLVRTLQELRLLPGKEPQL